MELYLNSASPYASRVLILALERDLEDRLTVSEVNPWNDPAEFHDISAIGRLPTLVLDDGTVLVESHIIMDALNTFGTGRDLWGPDKLETMARMGLAQGIIDCAYFAVIESRRPNDHRWPAHVARQRDTIRRALMRVQFSKNDFDMADITLVAALGYLDFRLADIEWRSMRTDLATRFDALSTRASVSETAPSDF